MSVITFLARFYFWPSGRLGLQSYWVLVASLFAIMSSAHVWGYSAILSYIIVIPVLAALARRLHDLDLSAWWVLFYFAPAVIVGDAHRMDLVRYATLLDILAVIVMGLVPGTRGDNRFGPPDSTFAALRR